MPGYTAEQAVSLLSKHYLLKGLDQTALRELGRLVDVVSFPKGMLIFSKGDSGDGMYGVLDGRVEITSIDMDGNEAILNIIHPGDFFGEIAMLDGRERTANALAMEDSQLMHLPHGRFIEFVKGQPNLCCELISFLCARVRQVNDDLERMVFLDCPGRLAKEILAMARDGDTTFPTTQEKISQRIGCSREFVSLRLNAWQQEGVIKRQGSRYRILNREALEDQVAI